MDYIALARKWRPKTFSQLVGQNHVTRTLIQSLIQKRIHHAYLFTGTRGVGKTSLARLFAKALSCEQGIQAEPCLVCDACVAIEEGRFIDLIEIDAASKTRVEDTRDLLDNVQYAPTQGRFKIYLIDEVHMLSQHSFNALLKTLEEPPSHVKFLLATTDPQKLPVTILSRCLQFHLKPLELPDIVQQLQLILEDEQLRYDQAALQCIAKAAQGSLRDALSLLDQAISAVDGYLSEAEVRPLLGFAQQEYSIQLLQALSAHSPHALLSISQQIATEHAQFRYVLDDLLDALHQMAIYQVLPKGNPLLDPHPELCVLAEQCSPEEVQLYYQIVLKGISEMMLAPSMAIGFNMILLRLYAFQPARPVDPPTLFHEESRELTQPVIAVEQTHTATEPSVQDIAPQKNDQNTTNKTEDWRKIVEQLNLRGLAATAADHAILLSKTDSSLTLGIEKRHASIFSEGTLKRLEEALSTYYQTSMRIILDVHDTVDNTPAQQKQHEATQQREQSHAALESDSFYQHLQSTFS